MRIEIDQSGRVEQLDTKTVVAGSNDEQHSISLTAGIKRRLKRHLRKTLFPTRDFPVILFSLLIYLLLQRFKHRPTLIEVDEEYSGKEDIIEETITKLFKLRRQRTPIIRFIRIGKHSNAHRVAWKAHRQRKSPEGSAITETEILNYWK